MQQSMGDQFLALVSQITEDHIGDENFTVSILAKEAGLSRSMLHRKLVRLTGKSPTELITETRLSRAYELITNETATISEIAYLVGYSSPSYFNRVFRKRYHCSPGEVRKNLSGKITRSNNKLRSPDRERDSILKRRYYVFVGTKIMTVILVATAAAFVLLELRDGLTSLLIMPEQAMNQLVILVFSGIVLIVSLSLIYHIRNAFYIGKTGLSLSVIEAELTRNPDRGKITSYSSILVIVAFITVNLIQKNHMGWISKENSIAVLALVNDCPERDNIYFINGMQESILNMLCKNSELRVVSRAAAEPVRDTTVAVPELCKSLKVNYLLMGSIQKHGDKILLTFNLVDKKGIQLWSDQYERKCNFSEDGFTVQHEIAGKVASALQAKIFPR